MPRGNNRNRQKSGQMNATPSQKTKTSGIVPNKENESEAKEREEIRLKIEGKGEVKREEEEHGQAQRDAEAQHEKEEGEKAKEREVKEREREKEREEIEREEKEREERERQEREEKQREERERQEREEKEREERERQEREREKEREKEKERQQEIEREREEPKEERNEVKDDVEEERTEEESDDSDDDDDSDESDESDESDDDDDSEKEENRKGVFPSSLSPILSMPLSSPSSPTQTTSLTSWQPLTYTPFTSLSVVPSSFHPASSNRGDSSSLPKKPETKPRILDREEKGLNVDNVSFFAEEEEDDDANGTPSPTRDGLIPGRGVGSDADHSSGSENDSPATHESEHNPGAGLVMSERREAPRPASHSSDDALVASSVTFPTLSTHLSSFIRDLNNFPDKHTTAYKLLIGTLIIGAAVGITAGVLASCGMLLPVLGVIGGGAAVAWHVAAGGIAAGAVTAGTGIATHAAISTAVGAAVGATAIIGLGYLYATGKTDCFGFFRSKKSSSDDLSLDDDRSIGPNWFDLGSN